jgi:hypothetical protein
MAPLSDNSKKIYCRFGGAFQGPDDDKKEDRNIYGVL